MMSPRAVYIPICGLISRGISQKFITPEMYQEVPGATTSFTGSWHSAVLSALSDLGVSMSAYPGDKSQYDDFLATPDIASQLADILPSGTYTFAYGPFNDSFTDSDKESYVRDYQSSQKRYYYHFQYKGVDLVLNLGIAKSGTVALSVMVNASGNFSSFVPASQYDKVKASFVGSLVMAVVQFVDVKGAGSLGTNYDANKTKDFVSQFSNGVKSSLETAEIPALTKYDIHSLLSDASPSKVWYSLTQRFAVYQCRFGSRLVAFSHSPSGWRVSTLRQCWMVRSDNKLLVSRKASFYEESLSATSPYKTAVMFRTAGQNHYLPLE